MAYSATIPCQNQACIFHLKQIPTIKGASQTLRHQRLLPRAMHLMQMTNNHHWRRQKTNGILHKKSSFHVPGPHVFWSENMRKHNLIHESNLGLIPAFATVSDSIPVVPSLSDVIRKLYTCINETNLEPLEDIIATDCLLEDTGFPYSFQGKKEVMSFISKLVESMGENVHFRIGTICEGGELIASVDWHLEWTEDQIPFTRGSSSFQCSIENDRLVIRKVQIITESPFKPGQLGLGLLKIVASLFDEFPKAAKWFLKSPHTIFKVVININSLLFAPIMNPVLAFYIILWKLIVRLLGYIISTLHFVAKFLNIMSSNSNPTNQA